MTARQRSKEYNKNSLIDKTGYQVKIVLFNTIEVVIEEIVTP